MKNESEGWRQLNERAAAHLRTGFADDVLRASRGPDAQVWQQLQEDAAARLGSGFADRVLRALRHAIPSPSLNSQFALAAVTAAICFAAVVYVHQRNVKLKDTENLAAWSQYAAQVSDLSYRP